MSGYRVLPGTDTVETPTRPSGSRLSATISYMADVLIREIICSNCLGRTRQVLPTLEPIIWLQAVSSEDGTYINYACPMCSKLSQSRIESEAKIFQDVDLTKIPDGFTVYIVFLKCAKPDYESPVILLAPTKKDVSDGEFMTHIREDWSTHGAVCAKGYPPTYPYEVRISKQLESEL